MTHTTRINTIETRVAANNGGTTISPLRSLLRVFNSCTVIQMMAATITTVPRIVMMLSDSTAWKVIEISRAKLHPWERVNLILRSISWRFGGHGFVVFKNYAGLKPGVVLFCG
jgi:hypothetical protein